jgi:aminoglycoside phosphotransferase (APT) family kinase protein
MSLANHPDTRRRVSEALVDTLADLHAIDISGPPIAELGKPAGFVARQVAGWTERWDRAKIAEVAEMEALGKWLADRIPADPEQPSVVHGDFKLDNVLLDPLDLGQPVAVFDWEMSALGDPLVDLGIFLAYWSPAAPAQQEALPTVTNRPGYLSKDGVVARYASRSGRDVSAIRFYETFALFKIAVVIQQIFYRYTRGQTDDPRFATFGDRVTSLACRAESLAMRSG